nr:uncharacterized protein LOC129439406 isoform X1 [Misgurnus anguillicaudatus]
MLGYILTFFILLCSVVPYGKVIGTESATKMTSVSSVTTGLPTSTDTSTAQDQLSTSTDTSTQVQLSTSTDTSTAQDQLSTSTDTSTAQDQLSTSTDTSTAQDQLSTSIDTSATQSSNSTDEPIEEQQGLTSGQIAGVAVGSITGAAVLGGGIYAGLRYSGKLGG